MSQSQTPIVEEAYTILLQLGGRRFLAFTGSNNLMAAGHSEYNPYPWLRMDLVENNAGVNRLKISLMPNDLYKMEFYHHRLVGAESIITQAKTFENVYFDVLQAIFTDVTGLYTSF